MLSQDFHEVEGSCKMTGLASNTIPCLPAQGDIYWGNGKENGNYYYNRVHIKVIIPLSRENMGLYKGCISIVGITENKMKATI